MTIGPELAESFALSRVSAAALSLCGQCTEKTGQYRNEMGTYLMRVTSLLLGFLTIAGSSMAPAATAPDQAVFSVIRQTDPTLVSDKILYRNMVAPDLDLVIAIGSTAEWAQDTPKASWFSWNENQKLGLFLQERARPDRIYLLALAAGSFDCGARIERSTSTDTVISCMGEKSYRGMNQKFVYDVRAKALVSHFAYQPFVMMRVFNDSGRTVLVGRNLTNIGTELMKFVVVEFRPDGSPEFRILPKAEAAPWSARVGIALMPEDPVRIRFGDRDTFTFDQGSIADSHGKKYPLPQSTYDDFAKARPGRVVDIIEETIGPVQLEGDKLWFGKTFYDGEGNSGVGGFGYFDTKDRQFHLFLPPEVADFSISAILVEPDTVWMGILHSGEWGGSPAGVLRYDRKTHTVHKYDLPDDVNDIVASGNRILASTSSGIAVIEGDETARYFVDRTTDGRLRIAQATVKP